MCDQTTSKQASLARPQSLEEAQGEIAVLKAIIRGEVRKRDIEISRTRRTIARLRNESFEWERKCYTTERELSRVKQRLTQVQSSWCYRLYTTVSNIMFLFRKR